ncbi:MAG: hypothetical protein M0C28_18345 [Candidatus Moduliflexus flocculans]|nr:hypothetical protein [Candidatus Moduliflexus flocculans]
MTIVQPRPLHARRPISRTTPRTASSCGAEASRCLFCEHPTCADPAHFDVRGMNRRVAVGNLVGARSQDRQFSPKLDEQPIATTLLAECGGRCVRTNPRIGPARCDRVRSSTMSLAGHSIGGHQCHELRQPSSSVGGSLPASPAPPTCRQAETASLLCEQSRLTSEALSCSFVDATASRSTAAFAPSRTRASSSRC